MPGGALLLLLALTATNPLAPAVLERMEAGGGRLRIHDPRKGGVTELELIELHPPGRTEDGTEYACAEMRQVGGGNVLYDVDFYVRDGRVVETLLHEKNGRDRLRGEGPTSAGRVAANAVLETVRRHLEQAEALGRGEILLPDPRDPRGAVRLRLGELPEKVYRTGDGSYYLHVGFAAGDGEAYDVDFYVRRDHAGYRLVEAVIHEVAGVDRLR
jgi:hypothetical protein